jgi:DDE superfamily endonuclease
MSVTSTAAPPVHDQTAAFLTGLLDAEPARRDTRTGTRWLAGHDQAILILRRLLDGTRPAQPGVDNTISESTAYGYLQEGVDVLAERAPSLKSALLAAKTAGYSHVTTGGPTAGVDLWWSAKQHHGGNVQVVAAPDGRPIRTFDVRPGREHAATAVRTHAEVLAILAEAGDDPCTLGDLGDEGEAEVITVAFKKRSNGQLTDVQQTFNKAHNGIRAIGERGNALLKMTFRALRNISLNPWRIGAIVAAAVTILHIDQAGTT